jgi:hypothetical protein
LQKTHKFRFQSAWLSLASVKALTGRIIVEFGAFALVQVVIFIALACHVADSQPRPPSRRPVLLCQRMFCRKAAVDQGAGWSQAFVFFEYDLKAKLCRSLHGLA